MGGPDAAGAGADRTALLPADPAGAPEPHRSPPWGGCLPLPRRLESTLQWLGVADKAETFVRVRQLSSCFQAPDSWGVWGSRTN